MYEGNLGDLIGRRVIVLTSKGEEEGVARYIRLAGDEQYLMVDLDQPGQSNAAQRISVGQPIHPDHIVGPVYPVPGSTT